MRNGGSSLAVRPPIVSTRRPWKTKESSRSLMLLESRFARQVADYNYRTDYFVYVFYFGLSGAGLTAGQADFVSIEIEDDAYFDWEKTTALCQQIAATAMEYVYIAQQVGVQITDGGTGRDLFSQSSVLPVMSGSTLFPYELPIPHRFVPK